MLQHDANDEEDEQSIDWQRPFEDEQINQVTVGQQNAKLASPYQNNKGTRGCHTRCIIHIDFDCFYAQVEMIRDPSLRDKPIAVYQKYILVTSNYMARGLGVKKMSSKADGLKVCPQLVLINGEDLAPYREYSAKTFELLKDFSPLVERLGLDENFVDVTTEVNEMLSAKSHDSVNGHCYGFKEEDVGTEALFSAGVECFCDCGCISRLAAASAIASNIRSALYAKLGLTSSAGIAHNKVLAKLIGKTHKPNQQTTIFPSHAVEFLSVKKVREIPGIGSRYAKLLNEMGIETVEQLNNKSKDSLVGQFGCKLGTFMSNIRLGIDNTEVVPSDNMCKTVSEEESFRELTDYGEVKRQMQILLRKVLARIYRGKRLPKTIRLSLRKHNTGDNYSRVSRQAPISTLLLSHADENEKVERILKKLLELFEKMVNRDCFDLAVINVGFTSFEEMSTSSISNFFKTDQTSSASKTTDNGDNKDRAITNGLDLSQKVFHQPAFQTDSHEAGPSSRTSSLGEAVACSSKDKESVFTDSYESNTGEEATKCKNQIDYMPKPISANTGSFSCQLPVTESLSGSSFKEPELPKGIDSTVFSALPRDIQCEILKSWRTKEDMTERFSTSKNTGKIKSPPKKKLKYTKSKEIKTKSIYNYFSK